MMCKYWQQSGDEYPAHENEQVQTGLCTDMPVNTHNILICNANNINLNY